MVLHGNAKLGLAGRLALVHAVEAGCVAEGGRGRLQRVAGDGASVVASSSGPIEAGCVWLRVGRRSFAAPTTSPGPRSREALSSRASADTRSSTAPQD
jgi:hypothetical protein